MDPKAPTISSERRKHKRYKVEFPVRVLFPDGHQDPFDAMIRDLSQSGAFIECALPIAVGSKVLVKFTGKLQYIPSIVTDIPVEEDRTLPPGIPPSAVIRWAQRSKGFGVEFVELPPDIRAYLDELIYSLEAKKSPKLRPR